MEEVESSMKLHCVKVFLQFYNAESVCLTDFRIQLLNKWAAFAASQVDSVDSNDSEFLKEVCGVCRRP